MENEGHKHHSVLLEFQTIGGEQYSTVQCIGHYCQLEILQMHCHGYWILNYITVGIGQLTITPEVWTSLPMLQRET